MHPYLCAHPQPPHVWQIVICHFKDGTITSQFL